MSLLAISIAAALSLQGSATGEDQADAATPAAPEVTTPEGETIVVEAPPTPLERQRELRNMVSDILRPARRGLTVSTFLAAACPKVFGLPDPVAEAIEARIRDNADTLGTKRWDRREPCRPNISVIFVPPSEGPARSWFDMDSEPLRELLSFERIRVLDEAGPVRAWNTKVTRGHDGHRLPDATGRRLENIDAFANRIPFATRLKVPLMVETLGSVVMIELMAADGRTIEQLADYATMRALADLDGIAPDTAPAAPTILTLFQDEPDEAPPELTWFDRSLLADLYDMSRNTPERRYVSTLAARAAQTEREAGLAPGQDLNKGSGGGE